MFKIAINKTDFEELVATASDEFIVDKKGNKKLKARRLTGTWITCFAKKINEYERDSFGLKGNFEIRLGSFEIQLSNLLKLICF
jgi:hypothetical protein